MTASACVHPLSIASLGFLTAPTPSNSTKIPTPGDRSLCVICPIDRLL
ncbi:hypothetical protein [Tychonema sp. LEGE 07203]|nr:hypothetical protein [Tychonema sp. LEGE 07203]MBE9092651.1 hypothetical protein [Tychonema sp. LEGE 07203]